MSGPRRIELDAVRADGWFERVLTGVPALARVCEGLGEALVALSLAAGVRIVAAGIDRGTGEISSLEWVQDVNGVEESHAGTPDSLRAAVLSTLTAYEPVPPTPPDDDVEALRRWVGMRDLLLAPLFGLQLVALEFDAEGEPSAWVTHEHGEEKVPYPQLRGFLRSRVAEVLRAPPRRGVSIDLEQAVVARAALDAGRYDEVVEKLGGWVPALMLYLRTPEGASMEPKQRADVARALRVLGAALHRLGRDEEAEETLRLGVQWAQDGDGAPELYAALATLLGELGRWGEAIGPLRRARGLEPALPGVDADLARAFLETGRAVAAVPLVSALSDEDPAKAALGARLDEALGEALSRWRERRAASEAPGEDEDATRPTEVPPPLSGSEVPMTESDDASAGPREPGGPNAPGRAPVEDPPPAKSPVEDPSPRSAPVEDPPPGEPPREDPPPAGDPSKDAPPPAGDPLKDAPPPAGDPPPAGQG